MIAPGSELSEPVRARKMRREDVQPQSVMERQETVSHYLYRRAQRRRERFLRRAEAFTMKKELARSAYLVGCILFDALVVPEPIFLVPSPFGWAVTAVAFAVIVWAEYRLYRQYFSLHEPTTSNS